MTFFYAIITVQFLYTFFGILLFAFLDKVNISRNAKIISLTALHPILTATGAWFTWSTFNVSVAKTGALMAASSLFWTLIGGKKFLSGLSKTGEDISINYTTPFLRNKTITIPLAEIEKSSLLTGKHFWNKPNSLRLYCEDNIQILPVRIGRTTPFFASV